MECYYADNICEGELWQCETCEEWYCEIHWHETIKGHCVECCACEIARKEGYLTD